MLSLLPAAAAAAKSLQSCPTLCDPTDSSPPGSPVPGILQARTLEWVAISYFVPKTRPVLGKQMQSEPERPETESRLWLKPIGNFMKKGH